MGDDENGQCDYLFKIILVGDVAVGKTNLITRYTSKAFSIESKPTLGVEFSNATLYKDGKIIKTQIWDTSGQEVYKSITKSYFKGALGALVVYDITKKSSFDNVNNWLNDIREASDMNPAIMMIGNKCDLSHLREVERQEATNFAKAKGIAFIETSALDLTNVELAFESMINEIYKERSKRPTEMHEEDSRRIERGTRLASKDDDTKPSSKKKKGCCG